MKKSERNKTLSSLPSIEAVLQDDRLSSYLRDFSHDFVAFVARKHVNHVRSDLKNGRFRGSMSKEGLIDTIVGGVMDHLAEYGTGSTAPAVNATGVILHTGLGRAPLSAMAVRHVQKIIKGYSTLEIDIETGKRGRREQRLEELFCFLSGAESGTVVNNNAAAVMIALNTLANGKEVIISRGELVEIGGSFRMPEIMKSSGAKMVEVGTTNKTKLSDYRDAITRKTGAILKVHTSNYRVMGFAETPLLKEICDLGASKKIPVIYDLGGGVMFDLRQFGLPYEPVVPDAIRSGASVVTFSGDKILGGPQSGIVLGKKNYLDVIKKNPIARTIRCDKLVLSALEGTMQSYLSGTKGFVSLPSSKLMLEKPEVIKKRALEVLSNIKKNITSKLKLSVEQSQAEVGSGAIPLEKLPSYSITIESTVVKPEKIAQNLRRNNPPIFGYINKDKVFLDMRTVFKSQIPDVINGIEMLFALIRQ